MTIAPARHRRRIELWLRGRFARLVAIAVTSLAALPPAAASDCFRSWPDGLQEFWNTNCVPLSPDACASSRGAELVAVGRILSIGSARTRWLRAYSTFSEKLNRTVDLLPEVDAPSAIPEPITLEIEEILCGHASSSVEVLVSPALASSLAPGETYLVLARADDDVTSSTLHVGQCDLLAVRLFSCEIAVLRECTAPKP